MQEFFMDYGLWLLIGLLVIIGLVFLLSGKDKVQDGGQAITPMPPAETPAVPFVEPAPVVAPVEPAAPVAEPVAPVAPVMPVAVEPLTEPVPASPAVATAPEGEDDLLRLKGVGPKLRTLLIDLGVTSFAQIAAWTDTDLAAIDARLGNFKGRPVRDQWIDQAKYLAAGDIAGFEAKYGKL
jgi:predicted flap endonuclease-1-like 5' DNA nuclease